jgi:cold shock CspA family protein
VPRRELVVSHRPGKDETHTDAYIAIRDTFKAMRRELEDYVREIRGDVKSHETSPHGKVSELFPMEDYGFIKTPDGRRVYFHRNSVLDGRFDELDLDSEVWFAEEMGDKADEITVQLSDGREFTATEIKADDRADVAIVRIAVKEKLPFLTMGDEQQAGDRRLGSGLWQPVWSASNSNSGHHQRKVAWTE